MFREKESPGPIFIIVKDWWVFGLLEKHGRASVIRNSCPLLPPGAIPPNYITKKNQFPLCHRRYCAPKLVETYGESQRPRTWGPLVG